MRDEEEWERKRVDELNIETKPMVYGEQDLGGTWPLTFIVDAHENRGVAAKVHLLVYNNALRWKYRAWSGKR